MIDFVALDTETGGFYPATAALLSIGACCSWSGALLEVFITVESQPGKVVEEQAARVNGYSCEEWERRGARPLHEAMNLLSAWLRVRKGERSKAVFVCHNLEFDRSHLREAERVTGQELPCRHDWRCSMVKMGELVDRGCIPFGSCSLERLGVLSGFWEEGKRPAVHPALGDALATRRGYEWLLAEERKEVDTLRVLYSESLKRARDVEDVLQMVQTFWDTPLGVDPPLTVSEVTARLVAFLKQPDRAIAHRYSLVRWVRDGSLPDEEMEVLVEQDGQEVSLGFVEGGEWCWLGAGMIEGKVTAWAEVPEGPGLAQRLVDARASMQSDATQGVPTSGKEGA